MSSFGSLFMIIRRSMRQHALSTWITIVSAALASGLAMATMMIYSATNDAFAGTNRPWDAVVGPPSTQEHLVLNTLFHLGVSPGKLKWDFYQALADHSGVETAVPYVLGDNYKGYRIIGTTTDVFAGTSFVAAGEPFDPAYRQAVVGNTVARQTGLVRGSIFQPSHGLDYDPRDPKTHPVDYTVVGVLEPTGTPDDRAIYIPVEGVWRMPDHEVGGTKAEDLDRVIPDEIKEISMVLVKFKDRMKGITALQMNYDINITNNQATMAWPIAQVMASLHRRLFWAIEVLRIVAVMVMVVAAGALLASIYNTMNERRREFAVLRALGARKRTVFGVIIGEAALIALVGGLLGYLVYFGILWRVRGMLLESSGVLLEFSLGNPILWITPLGMLLVGALAGVLPALKAYSTDVSKTLSQSAA